MHKAKKIEDLKEAWELYIVVYRRLSKHLKQVKKLELINTTPSLLKEKSMELAVPGTYRANKPPVRIESFAPELEVMKSKHRPRRVVIHGDNGREYTFLLKGNEDLRLDERVMQLFRLVNSLLKKDVRTRKHYLTIDRYSISPLSPTSGLIGWVLHSDTFHQLISEYRNSNNIILDFEYKYMTKLNQKYEELPVEEKIEIFNTMIQDTSGDDLARVLWLKSPNSEVWVNRRNTYTKSLAVMSMVGYVLGLGDRHPSNLMLDRHTGKVIHIDFGDCFEVAMQREYCPERVPFRLTRMLVNAMEVSGIEGTFRTTCINVMTVLREQSEIVLSALEAFVHDPLISLRWLPDEGESKSTTSMSSSPTKLNSLSPIGSNTNSPTGREVLNEKALEVINRIKHKLRGTDFGEDILTVPKQVNNLIEQAQSVENLCQSFVGWCPFW